MPLKLISFIRRRWAARPKRTLQDWIALTIARAFSFAIVGGLVYVTYIVEMTSYDDFRKCKAGMAPRRPACGGLQAMNASRKDAPNAHVSRDGVKQ